MDNGLKPSNNATLVSNLNDTQESSKKLNKINMEAYQAYYNTNESSLAAGNAIPPGNIKTIAGEGEVDTE